MKIKPGIAVAIKGLTQKQIDAVIDLCVMHGAKIGDNVGGVHHFIIYGDSSLEVYKSATDQGMKHVTAEQILGADEKPNFDFSRRPDSGENEDADQPAVGSHLEVTFGNKSIWHECVVLPAKKIAIDRYAGWHVMAWQDDFEFRPLKTERERAIEEISSIAITACGHESGLIPCRNIARALYDAGYRKEGK